MKSVLSRITNELMRIKLIHSVCPQFSANKYAWNIDINICNLFVFTLFCNKLLLCI